MPIDFVADAIVALVADAQAAGQTFHLTAGRGREVSIGEVVRDAAIYAGIKRRPCIPFWIFKLLRETPALQRIMGARGAADFSNQRNWP